MSFQRQVLEFHKAMNLTIGKTPEIRDAELRAKIILEEAFETAAALVGKSTAVLLAACAIDDCPDQEPDLAKAIDGCMDVHYVVSGTSIALGIDEKPFFDEVHRANMAKVGGPIRTDGKRLKPEGWTAPNIEGMVEEAKKGLWLLKETKRLNRQLPGIALQFPGARGRRRTHSLQFQSQQHFPLEYGRLRRSAGRRCHSSI